MYQSTPEKQHYNKWIMQYIPLGSSGVEVSRACLGSMTWAQQNTQKDANAQLNYALECGINFIDTAEMYPVPPQADLFGNTERMLGNWLADEPARRKRVIIATKITGSGVPYIREGGKITPQAIVRAVDDSLKRLQTDYIDLYQLHWPNRPSPSFGRHWPNALQLSTISGEEQIADMTLLLGALQDCICAGKIRFCGLSNETAWGIDQYHQISQMHALPKMVSVQNEFSLLQTKDWPYVLESCVLNNLAYLPWSPLAGGVLTGKYMDGKRPAGSRWLLEQRQGLFRDTPTVHNAVAAYATIAADNDLSPAQLALAWCNQVSGITSTIIGATTMEQLQENIDAFSITLNTEVLDAIHKVLKQHPAPF